MSEDHDAHNERTSLLGHSQRTPMASIHSELRTEIYEVVKLAGPLVLVTLARHWIIGMTVFTVGRISVLHLAAASFGLLHITVVGFSIMVGFNSALDTLSNQAAGSKNTSLASLYMLRQCVALLSLMPVMFILVWFGTDILHFISPQADLEMLALTRTYLRIMVWIVPMYGVSDCLRRFCYSIGLVNGAIISGAIGAFVSIGLNYLLVLGPDRYRLGFIGAPIATLVAYLTIFVVLLAYTIIQTPSRAWCGFSRSMFRDLGINYRLGFQGACSLCSEWWAYEFLGIGSTFLGPATQAATAIFTSVLSILFSIPFAISLAAGIRVGYLIGAGNAGSAQVAAVAAQRIVIVISFMGGVALFLSRHSLGRLYSGDPHATKMVSDYILLLVIVAVNDSLQVVNHGVLRAQINVFCYWGMGLWISAAATVAFRTLGSLWSGMAIAVTVAQLAVRYRTKRINWQEQVCAAKARMQRADIPASNTRDESA